MDGLNWYAYASNNPLGVVDPMGLEDESTDPDSSGYVDPRYNMSYWQDQAKKNQVATGNPHVDNILRQNNITKDRIDSLNITTEIDSNGNSVTEINGKLKSGETISGEIIKSITQNFETIDGQMVEKSPTVTETAKISIKNNVDPSNTGAPVQNNKPTNILEKITQGGSKVVDAFGGAGVVVKQHSLYVKNVNLDRIASNSKPIIEAWKFNDQPLVVKSRINAVKNWRTSNVIKYGSRARFLKGVGWALIAVSVGLSALDAYGQLSENNFTQNAWKRAGLRFGRDIAGLLIGVGIGIALTPLLGPVFGPMMGIAISYSIDKFLLESIENQIIDTGNL